jgi:hypothetical protein
MALRWFVGLNIDKDAWDASTFSQNRRRRFDESGVLEKLFDETVKRAMVEKLVSRHASADGTLVRANASYKSFVPIEVAMDPEEYKKRLRAQDRQEGEGDGPQDPGNRAVNFRGEKRSNQKHLSATGLLDREIQPHIATDRGKHRAHTRVRMRQRGEGYELSQRCRKKIEELFGEPKDWHGMRRFLRRGLMRVREEALLIGWVLNLKRLAYALPPPEQLA